MSGNNFQARIYGDSLPLPRIGSVAPSERYPYMLRQWWMQQQPRKAVDVLERTHGGYTIDRLYRWYRHDVAYFDLPADALIIHSGICDCAPRPLPKWLRNTVGALHPRMRHYIIRFLHHNRSWLLKTGWRWYNTSSARFLSVYTEWLQAAATNFPRIYTLNIAPTNASTEQHSPGLGRSIERYNALIRQAVETVNADNVHLIDIHEAIKAQGNINAYINSEDGHHFTARAHILIRDAIVRREATHNKQNG